MNQTKILIIEDNPNLRELYQMAFESTGAYQVCVAEDGLSGVTMAAEIKPDVILLDLMMPNMDGFEVLEALRKNMASMVPVFITSNLNDPHNMDRALKNGGTQFLKKADYTPRETVAQIEAYLGGASPTPAPVKLTEEIDYKVLLVEDNADQAELLAVALEQKDMRVSVAVDGVEGVNQAIEIEPDVILLDLMMPNMNGFSVLETLHTEVKLPIPIIVTSQLDSKADRDRAKSLGAVAFLKKSEYLPDQIAEKVIDYLEADLMV